MELRYWAASQPLPNVGLHFGYCHKKTTGFRGAAPAGELSPVERPRLTEIETKSLYHMKDETGFSTSSTAQGGGGSFKDRKPIGDVHGWDSKKTV